MLVIDVCISTNLSIKHKKVKKFVSNYPDFQRYVATTPMLLLQTFHALQFENPGSRPESNETVVMKLHHNCIS